MTALPEGLTPGTWNLDPTHTAASFTVRHAGISKVRGQFAQVSGTLEVGQSLEDLTFQAVLDVDSISTGNADRDGHLKSDDFFGVSDHPEIRFVSTSVENGSLHGDLTIKGVTQPVTLDFEYEGSATDPFGAFRAGFSGETKISRKEFGLTWNAALEAGGVLVSDEVRISIEAQFVAPTAA